MNRRHRATAAATRQLLLQIYDNVDRKHTLRAAAALAYYFILSLFPALVLLSAFIAFLPGHDLFNRTIDSMARFLPGTTMDAMNKVLGEIITRNRGTFFSLGFVGTLWSVSTGFAATIEALNEAYGMRDDRPFWKTRILALGLASLTGALLLTALSVMILGPRFGQWLAARIYLSRAFVLLWPYIHWSVAVGFTVLAVEALYLLAPSRKQTFIATLPGACLAVACWLGLSSLFGAYCRHFETFNQTYGVLGAAIVLLIWLYWTGFAILLGAELNADLAHMRSFPSVQDKSPPSGKIDQAA